MNKGTVLLGIFFVASIHAWAQIPHSHDPLNNLSSFHSNGIRLKIFLSNGESITKDEGYLQKDNGNFELYSAKRLSTMVQGHIEAEARLKTYSHTWY